MAVVVSPATSPATATMVPAGHRRLYRTLRDLRRFIGRRGFRGPRRHQQVAPAVPNRLRTGPAAALLEADGNVDPALAPPPPPPPFWCSMHGWVICPLHEYSPAASPTGEDSLPSPTISIVGLGARSQSPTSVFEFGGASSTAAPEANDIAPRVPMRPPPPTSATPPSPRADVRRRLAALGLPLSSPASATPSGSHGRRSGTWSAAALGLANGRADGIAPGARPRGDSSNEFSRGGSTSVRR